MHTPGELRAKAKVTKSTESPRAENVLVAPAAMVRQFGEEDKGLALFPAQRPVPCRENRQNRLEPKPRIKPTDPWA